MTVSVNATQQETNTLPQRVFGKTGELVPILGLGTAPGGFGLNDFDAVDVIHAAIDNGITYLDTAPAYDRAQIQLGEVLPERRDEVFLVTKVDSENGKDAIAILENSLREMKTDAVDCVFVHSVGNKDVDRVLAENGALEALRAAKTRGLTRFIGFTSHHCPGNSARILEEADVDAAMFALNYADKHTYDFQGRPLELAREQNAGVAAMKVYGGAPDMIYDKPTRSLMSQTQQDHGVALRYALSLEGVSLAVIGMFSVVEIHENVAYARNFEELSETEMNQAEARGKLLAEDWEAHFGKVK